MNLADLCDRCNQEDISSPIVFGEDKPFQNRQRDYECHLYRKKDEERVLVPAEGITHLPGQQNEYWEKYKTRKRGVNANLDLAITPEVKADKVEDRALNGIAEEVGLEQAAYAGT